MNIFRASLRPVCLPRQERSVIGNLGFETPLKLHGSKTPCITVSKIRKFETPLKLHGSKTYFLVYWNGICLRPFEITQV